MVALLGVLIDCQLFRFYFLQYFSVLRLVRQSFELLSLHLAIMSVF